jgi:D-psicose/D-tagatose/L-ribulose 3-epimerase
MLKIYTNLRNIYKQGKLCFGNIIRVRIGLNTFLESSGFTDSELALVEQFRKYGAEVVELAIVDPEQVTPSKVLEALQASGLEGPVLCGAFTPGRDLRGSNEAVLQASTYISELIDLAQTLGAKVICGPMYSETGRVNAHSEDEREKQLAQIAGALKPLCDQAASAGVVLALEPLNRFETDCINTLEQTVGLIERVGSPALKIHIDTFHMNIEEDDSAAAIVKYGKHIAHVHASASHRGLLGADQVDWNGVFGALEAIDYTGDVIIESFAMENKSLAKAASIWRQLYSNPEQLAVEGLAFLRKNLRRPVVLA